MTECKPRQVGSRTRVFSHWLNRLSGNWHLLTTSWMPALRQALYRHPPMLAPQQFNKVGHLSASCHRRKVKLSLSALSSRAAAPEWRRYCLNPSPAALLHQALNLIRVHDLGCAGPLLSRGSDVKTASSAGQTDSHLLPGRISGLVLTSRNIPPFHTPLKWHCGPFIFLPFK